MRTETEGSGTCGAEQLIFGGGEIPFGSDQHPHSGGQSSVFPLEVLQDSAGMGWGIRQGRHDEELGQDLLLNPCGGRRRESDFHPPGVSGLLCRLVGNPLPPELLGLRVIRTTDAALRQQGNDPCTAEFHRPMQQTLHGRALGDGLEQDQLAGPAGMLNPAHNPHPDIISTRREHPPVKFSSRAIQQHNRIAGPDPQDPDGVISLSFRKKYLGGVGTKARNEETVHALRGRS